MGADRFYGHQSLTKNVLRRRVRVRNQKKTSQMPVQNRSKSDQGVCLIKLLKTLFLTAVILNAGPQIQKIYGLHH